MGESVPRPVSRELVEAIQSVEVTHADEGRSGFQIIFRVGRRDRGDLAEYRLLANPIFKVFSRVTLVVTLGAAAQVLIDGVITNQQLAPNPEPGKTTLTLTGEDISVMMDLEQRSLEHKAQDEASIAEMILRQYKNYGIEPQVIKPTHIDRPTGSERIPVQQGTDLAYLRQIGQRFAHVFYIIPGQSMGTSIAYWGPPQRQTQPQKTLTVNMGSFTNVRSINFQYNGMSATRLEGSAQDRRTNEIRSVREDRSDRPPLSQFPALGNQRHYRVTQFRQTGRDTAQAGARAQAEADRSVDNVVTASGELDTVHYGSVLKLRGLVGLRGVGHSYDGLYYVKRVSHRISPGQYQQSFTLTREGLVSTKQRLAV